jgi:hypothetical protein
LSQPVFVAQSPFDVVRKFNRTGSDNWRSFHFRYHPITVEYTISFCRLFLFPFANPIDFQCSKMHVEYV